MKINSDEKTFKPPYKVVLLDAMDAFYYADIMDKMEEYDSTENLELAKKLSDALFIIKNYKWESLAAMNEVDGGWDVRVYDANLSCIYAAHTKYLTKWIGDIE
jgi:hypothetical protein